MNALAISDKVWFEEDLLGATLNFYSDCQPGGVLFRVGISHRSLQDCDKALSGRVCSWTISDGTLSLWGDQEEVTLAFVALGKSGIQASVRFHGAALKTFRYVISSLAFRQLVACN